MRIRIIDQADSRFSLSPEAQTALFALLTSESFCAQVCQETGASQVEFTHKLFKPVPYTTATPKGMAAEFEPYHESPDYAVINVPPTFMFKAKIFSPNRLCAIYRKVAR
ncbi:hypothetical protein IQ241_10430 [Romeria aff. gracilis LEGE 07310]|uniref:Uncharacterized protein n=1 Tax=Vasconcelosia minhoensis LEGE 07310 TaxID=915328 RepID=A0A8J7DBG5_9CYAN|nr:hypothetical protein [Romeria gracilis]MBE9077707.1 hypothetical protein [Romeria aff. gracilis LEGE 07310]